MSEHERLLATWSNKPYVDHRKRHYTVEHRLLAYWTPGVGVDIEHEIKCERRDIDRWTLAEAYEFRTHGVDHLTTEAGEGSP